MARKCCCGPCDGGDETSDTFSGSTPNRRWVQGEYTTGTASIVSGKFRFSGFSIARKRCHTPPADWGGEQTIVAAEVNLHLVETDDFEVIDLASSDWVETPEPHENENFRATLGVLHSGGAHYEATYTDHANLPDISQNIASPAVASGDLLRIEIEYVSAGMADIRYLINGALVHTFAGKAWDWTDRIYVQLRVNSIEPDTIIEWDNYFVEIL